MRSSVLKFVAAATLLMASSPTFSQHVLATAPASNSVFGVEYPIRPGENGWRVANLHTALKYVYRTGYIKTFQAPDAPTYEELQRLMQGLDAESATDTFGGATQKVVQYIQVQNGFGDQLNGVVDVQTAALLNTLAPEMAAGHDLTCSIVRVAAGDKRAPEPNPVTTEMLAADGRVVKSSVSYLRLNEQATLSDPSLAASWCRFSLANFPSAYRGVALYGEKGRKDVLAIPAQ